MLPSTLTLGALRALYLDRPFAVKDAVEEVLARVALAQDPAIFLSLVAPDDLRRTASELLERAPDPSLLPLWGIPFAVKDDIDVAGLDTTAACPAFAYRPEKDATVVARLRAAGALVIGKTNLDQFATAVRAPPIARRVRCFMRIMCRVDRARVRRSRSRQVSFPLRLAPTRRAPVGYRRRSTISSGSKSL